MEGGATKRAVTKSVVPKSDDEFWKSISGRIDEINASKSEHRKGRLLRILDSMIRVMSHAFTAW